MRVIRPIEPRDKNAFERMAFTASMGIRSLPKDSEKLYEKILQSQSPSHHLYIFVLEDLETGAIEGTSGIQAKTAVEEPEYTYCVETIDNKSQTEHVPETLRVLRPKTHRNGPTEICGLYLMPYSRMSHLGRLLSYSRFLFIAGHPGRFAGTIIAEMRGYFDEEEKNPFWTNVGRHFYNVPYEDAIDRYSLSTDFIPGILPKYPIYIDLLPEGVRDVIGRTHPNTEPALNLLKQNGFSLTNEVDIFDGGPKIQATTKEVATIKNSQTASVTDIAEELEDGDWIISNLSLDFRAAASGLIQGEKGVTLSRKTADALGVKIGDTIRYIPL